MAKSRRSTAENMSLHLEGIPRPLVEACKLKAADEFPPMSLKWKIVELMGRYVHAKESKRKKR